MTAAVATAPMSAQPPDAAARLRRRLAGLALRTRMLDRVLRRRAADICAKSDLLAQVMPRGLCLDIGAGLGHLLERVLAHYPAVRGLGIDPQWRPLPPVAARLARSAGGRGLFCTGDGRALPVADGQAQTVLIAFVLHHLAPADQEQVLREAARVLEPGGRLILLEDTPDSVRDRGRVQRADRRLNFEPPGEIHAYRAPTAWCAELTRHGFAVGTVTSFSRIFPPATLRPVPHGAFMCVRAG
jgi:ubiquinone/menaquinone biosynthesis C-methylase UbiE